MCESWLWTWVMHLWATGTVHNVSDYVKAISRSDCCLACCFLESFAGFLLLKPQNWPQYFQSAADGQLGKAPNSQIHTYIFLPLNETPTYPNTEYQMSNQKKSENRYWKKSRGITFTH